MKPSYEYAGIYDTQKYLRDYDRTQKTATDEGIKRARDSFHAKLDEIHARKNTLQALESPAEQPAIRNVPRKLDTTPKPTKGFVNGWSQIYG